MCQIKWSWCSNKWSKAWKIYFAKLLNVFGLVVVINVSNFWTVGQRQKYGVRNCLLKYVKVGHINKKCISVSIAFILHLVHFLWIQSIPLWRPVSIFRLCADKRNLVKTCLNLLTCNVLNILRIQIHSCIKSR